MRPVLNVSLPSRRACWSESRLRTSPFGPISAMRIRMALAPISMTATGRVPGVARGPLPGSVLSLLNRPWSML